MKFAGLYVIGHVNIGKLSDMETDIISTEHKHWLNLVDELDIKAFVELTLSSSVREGVEHLIRISGRHQVYLKFVPGCSVFSFKCGWIFSFIKKLYNKLCYLFLTHMHYHQFLHIRNFK